MAENYQASLDAETRLFEHCTDVHDLPGIFHYWSNRYVRPKLASLGFDDAPQMFRNYLDQQCRSKKSGTLRFISLGAGNCDLEIQLARDLRQAGHRHFILECVDLNQSMLQRASSAAHHAGIDTHLLLTAADLNSWTPARGYDAVIACHSLHHVVNLEGLFEGVQRSLTSNGRFLISDMIGRNGHQRWPEALEIVQEFWSKLPPSYRFHRILKCYEETFVNRDCSVEGFEGVRAQDILPLLLDRFHFQLFAGFANVIDPFVDRAFGPNFDASSAWDRNFIDEVQRRDEQEVESGRLKPTHMMAVIGNEPCTQIGSQSPRDCVRVPEQILSADPSPAAVYQWGAWPHPTERELEIACGRLAESGTVISERTTWALRLDNELQERTKWVHEIEAQLEERTRWAFHLQQDLAEHAALAAHLKDELDQRSAWTVQLEAERVRLEAQVRAYAAEANKLEAELADRSAWALRLQRDLEEQTRRAEAAVRELQSYLRNPLAVLRRMIAGIGRRLKRV